MKTYFLFPSDAVSYGAPAMGSQPKRAKLDADLKRNEKGGKHVAAKKPMVKPSTEPAKKKEDVSQQKLDLSESESVEMKKARQRAEIEKVFEIARAEADAKSKVGTKTKLHVEKRKEHQKASSLQQKDNSETGKERQSASAEAKEIIVKPDTKKQVGALEQKVENTKVAKPKLSDDLSLKSGETCKRNF